MSKDQHIFDCVVVLGKHRSKFTLPAILLLLPGLSAPVLIRWNIQPLSSRCRTLYCRAPPSEFARLDISILRGCWREPALFLPMPSWFGEKGGTENAGDDWDLVTGHGGANMPPSSLCWPHSGGFSRTDGKRAVSSVARNEKRGEPCWMPIGGRLVPSWSTNCILWASASSSVLLDEAEIGIEGQGTDLLKYKSQF